MLIEPPQLYANEWQIREIINFKNELKEIIEFKGVKELHLTELISIYHKINNLIQEIESVENWK